MNLQITKLTRGYFQISAEEEEARVEAGTAGGSVWQGRAASPVPDAQGGLSGLRPNLTEEQHNRFPRGRW